MFRLGFWRRFVLIGCLTGTLAACGRLRAEPTPTPTVAVSPTPTASPTATPRPTATPSPTPSPTPLIQAVDVSAWATYRDAAKGLTLRYPADWISSPYLFFQAFTSDVTLLNNPTEATEGGVALVFVAPTIDLPGDNPLEVLDNLIGQFGPGGQTAARSAQAPTLTTIQGWPAAATTLTAPADNGELILMMVGAIMGQPNGAVLVGVTPESSTEQFRPIFEAMFQSMNLTAPSAPETPALVAGLHYGAAITATLAAGARDAWPFEGRAGDVFTLAVTPVDEAFDATLDVLNRAGDSLVGGPVDQSFSGEIVPYVVAPVSGTYTVTVAAASSGSGAYVLRLALAPEVRARQVITSAVATGGETALALRGAPGSVVDLYIEEISGDLDVAINVLDVSGASLVGGEVDKTAAIEEIRGVRMPEDGLAIIVARGYAATAGQFRVQASAGQP